MISTEMLLASLSYVLNCDWLNETERPWPLSFEWSNCSKFQIIRSINTNWSKTTKSKTFRTVWWSIVLFWATMVVWQDVNVFYLKWSTHIPLGKLDIENWVGKLKLAKAIFDVSKRFVIFSLFCMVLFIFIKSFYQVFLNIFICPFRHNSVFNKYIYRYVFGIFIKSQNKVSVSVTPCVCPLIDQALDQWNRLNT